MSKLEKLERMTEDRVPPATKGGRKHVEDFLEYFERRFVASLDAGRQLSMTDDGTSLKGQLNYWRHCIDCLRWLKSMNQQRRDHG